MYPLALITPTPPQTLQGTKKERSQLSIKTFFQGILSTFLSGLLSSSTISSTYLSQTQTGSSSARPNPVKLPLKPVIIFLADYNSEGKLISHRSINEEEKNQLVNKLQSAKIGHKAMSTGLLQERIFLINTLSILQPPPQSHPTQINKSLK